MKRVWLGVFAALACGGSALAQEPQVGDTVRLEDRDIHIPAHVAPGDLSVPFRFAGDSLAELLAFDRSSGWFQVQGERVGGTTEIAWIARRYIVHIVSGGGVGVAPSSVEPGWCPGKGSSAPHVSGRIRIAAWNLGNLHAVDGQSTFIGDDPSEKRFAMDYQRIRCYVRMIDPDILAVQEVDGADALRRVVDTDVYDVHVSSRPRTGSMGGRQNTGFAYKRGLAVQPRPDLTSLNTSGGLRRGTRIDLTHGGATVKFLSVHLKSGCFTNGMSGSSCTTLLNQVLPLETWIDMAASGAEPFVVLGDFNRRLNEAGDSIWMNLDDAQPANADLTALTENMPISCRDNTFPEFIDHIVVDPRALALVDRSSFRHVTFRQADRPVWDKISDHCPVVAEMWLP